MSVLAVSVSVRSALVVVLFSGSAIAALALPIGAQEVGNWDGEIGSGEEQFTSTPDFLSNLKQSVTGVESWIAQVEASLVQITRVRVEETEAGLQVVLETDNDFLPVPETRSVGNALIADIPNATITEEFSQANPIEGIALVSVTELPGDRVRVAITGTDASPAAEVSEAAGGLVLAVTLGDADAIAEEDAIQVVVTGGQDDGYNPSNASVGTRTDTPLRDIPQSIQVIPQQVIEDQQAQRLDEVLRNVPGTAQGADQPLNFSTSFFIRGFDSSTNLLRNGLADYTLQNVGYDAANIERVEVLRGPTSVLYGQAGGPFGGFGGSVNLVTERPLSDPYYQVEALVGNFDSYRGALDLSGPLNDSETVLYRLNASAQRSESFIDFFEAERYFISPVVTWLISDQTEITVDAQYISFSQPFQFGLPARGTVLPNPNGEIPRDRNVSEPTDDTYGEVFRIGYDLEHRFSEEWQLRNAFNASFLDITRDAYTYPLSLQEDNRTLTRGLGFFDNDLRSYNLDTFVSGEFTTGGLNHQLVTGVNLSRVEYGGLFINRPAASIDIYDPIYGQPPGDIDFESDSDITLDSVGVYIQDLIAIADNFKVLLGGRFDITNQNREEFTATDTVETSQQDEAFSPRLGLVYQPIPAISLYASYGRAFQQVVDNQRIFDPERATQYEVGVRADISDRLSANLALYRLTRSNVLTPDPEDLNFSIQTGEQRSQGIELDMSGEILPGWNIIAGYAYTDARVTEDNTFEEGNRLNNIPEHSANLWTTYEIQNGDFAGLGFGLGLFLVGDRFGDTQNTFELPSYLRTDAAIFYRREQLRAAINIKNLFDIEYFEATQQNINRVYQGNPITVEATVSWEF
ncbi:TonB-dependent siderophore receptor [Oculatella sp. LEGE 06141]|uniref:TonB-dependent siderophore receptor n=1 Tax=Oculatella sp. LEGE 06141 TaxID=1828648 RepID=UPI001881264A|nr:TonB-dependent siderophore receptor [Oculatella sp. LEGE 06141]MBE9180609.1 TonB-dependent siderophore receptor [Oculatella sp. LEGE 06141]